MQAKSEAQQLRESWEKSSRSGVPSIRFPLMHILITEATFVEKLKKLHRLIGAKLVDITAMLKQGVNPQGGPLSEEERISLEKALAAFTQYRDYAHQAIVLQKKVDLMSSLTAMEDSIDQILERLDAMMNSPDFQAYIRALINLQGMKAETIGMTYEVFTEKQREVFDDISIQPTQRLARYPLMLQDLLKEIKKLNDCDFFLVDALEELEKIEFKSKAAYIRCKNPDALFHLKEREPLGAAILRSKEKLRTFDQQIQGTDEGRGLSLAQLEAIEKLTGHKPQDSDYQAQAVAGRLLKIGLSIAGEAQATQVLKDMSRIVTDELSIGTSSSTPSISSLRSLLEYQLTNFKFSLEGQENSKEINFKARRGNPLSSADVASIKQKHPYQETKVKYYDAYLKNLLAIGFPEYFNLENDIFTIDERVGQEEKVLIVKALGLDKEAKLSPKHFDAKALQELSQRSFPSNPLWLVLELSLPVSNGFSAKEKAKACFEVFGLVNQGLIACEKVDILHFLGSLLPKGGDGDPERKSQLEDMGFNDALIELSLYRQKIIDQSPLSKRSSAQASEAKDGLKNYSVMMELLKECYLSGIIEKDDFLHLAKDLTTKAIEEQGGFSTSRTERLRRSASSLVQDFGLFRSKAPKHPEVPLCLQQMQQVLNALEEPEQAMGSSKTPR